MMAVKLSKSNKNHDGEYLPGKLPENLFGILADLLWAKPQLLSKFPYPIRLGDNVLFSSGSNHISTIWCLHPGTETRCSLPLPVRSL